MDLYANLTTVICLCDKVLSGVSLELRWSVYVTDVDISLKVNTGMVIDVSM